MNQRPLHHLARRSVRKVGIPGPLLPREKPAIDLSTNACLFAGPEAHYPETHPPALARRYLATAGLGDSSPDEVIFTVGSGDGLDLVLRAFGEPGEDAVLYTPPVFPMYAHWATAAGLATVAVPLRGENFDRLDVDAIVAASAKITLLCTPNNPIGTSLDEAEVRAVIERARGIVVVDEAYLEYSGRASAAALVGRYENLVVLRTFSKAWGLASVRCGAVIAQAGVIEALKRVQSPYAMSTVAMRMVEERLAEGLGNVVELTRHEREWLRVRLGVLPNVRKVFPSEANFLFVVCEDDAMGKLAREGIAVANGGWAVQGGLRITVGPREVGERVLGALAR